MFARVLAMFWGGLSLLNLVGELVRRGFDGNLWWVDLRAAPWIAHPVLLAGGAGLLAYAIRPPGPGWRRRSTQAGTGVLAAFALWNSAEFYWLLARGEIASSAPVPLSLAVAASLGWILFRISRPPVARAACPYGSRPRVPSSSSCAAGVSRPRLRLRVAAPALAGCMIAFTLLQIALFGSTDYRRPADAIVVFGAGVTPDGQCSQALYDRVRTACLLYQKGLGRRLIFSGGPTPGNVHETDAMRDLAVRLGVAPQDITLDREGVSTKATVRNTAEMLDQLGARRVLAVSQGYHLPRIKMTYQRKGLEVFTVPAETTQPLQAMPVYVAREVLALWYYYVRPMGG